jgi:hypothetical protein
LQRGLFSHSASTPQDLFIGGKEREVQKVKEKRRQPTGHLVGACKKPTLSVRLLIMIISCKTQLP